MVNFTQLLSYKHFAKFAIIFLILYIKFFRIKKIAIFVKKNNIKKKNNMELIRVIITLNKDGYQRNVSRWTTKKTKKILVIKSIKENDFDEQITRHIKEDDINTVSSTMSNLGYDIFSAMFIWADKPNAIIDAENILKMEIENKIKLAQNNIDTLKKYINS